MRVKIISILPEELASAQSRGSIRGSIQRTSVHDGERRLIVIDPELSVLLRWVAISHARHRAWMASRRSQAGCLDLDRQSLDT